MDLCACNPSEWIPRGECGPWTDTWISVYMTGQLLIVTAYLFIPTILMWAAYIEERVERPAHALTDHERKVARLSAGLFIAMCGLGHMEGIVAFVWPHYPTFAVWHMLTGIVSWWAALVAARLRAKVVAGI